MYQDPPPPAYSKQPLPGQQPQVVTAPQPSYQPYPPAQSQPAYGGGQPQQPYGGPGPSYGAQPAGYGAQPAGYGPGQPPYGGQQPPYGGYGGYGGGGSNNNNMMMSNNVVIGGAAPAPTTIVHTRRGNNDCCAGESPDFKSTAGLVTGLIMLIGGILTIIIITVSLVVSDGTHSGIGSSIAAAIFFYIPTGCLGIGTHSKSYCVVMTFLVMCILSSLEAFGMICYEATAAAIYSYDEECYYYVFCSYEENTVATAMHALACIIAFVELVCAFVGMVFCCSGMKRRVAATTTVVQSY